jgi:hypothetical protein
VMSRDIGMGRTLRMGVRPAFCVAVVRVVGRVAGSRG